MLKKIHILPRPATILITTAILFFLFLGFAFFEFQRSNQDILAIMEEEGYVLLDALMASSERSILAYEELEMLVRKHLYENAAWLNVLDIQKGLNQGFLDQIMDTLDLYRIHVFDKYGNRQFSDTPHHRELLIQERSEEYRQWITPLLEGKVDSIDVERRTGIYQKESRYVVAIRRQKGGVILLTADANQLLEIRKKVGPGRLVQEIGGRPGVAYVILQDTLGIIMASRDVVGINRILADPFLKQIFINQSRGSRIVNFGEKTVFEVAATFRVEENQLGLLRLGLEMDHYHDIVSKARYRLLFIGLICIFFGIIGFNLFMANQNVRILSESYQRVQTHTGEILQNLEDAVIALDGDGKVTLFNHASETLFRITSNKVIGKRIQSLRIPCKKIILESLESQRAQNREETCIMHGQKTILAMRTSLVTGPHGRIEAVILVATDLTHRRQLELQLRRQEKLRAIGELASGVAHEIRNPINAIGMIAQRFLREFKPQKDEKEYHSLASAVIQEVRRINDIIKRFLRFAKPSKLRRDRVNIEQLLKEVAKFFESSTLDRGIKFSVQAIDKKHMTVDQDQLKQALLNILNNALDASSKGGNITLSGRIVHESYWIEISDTGLGIDENQKGKLFDLYYTTKPDGTGMGLPIVYQIVQGHGGDIDVESEKGKGSLFRIRLPIG